MHLSLVDGQAAPDHPTSQPLGRFGAAIAGPSGACRSSVVHVWTVNCFPPALAQTRSSVAEERAAAAAVNDFLTSRSSRRHRHPLYSPGAVIFTPRAERLHARGNLGNGGVFRRAHQHFKGGATLDVLSQKLQGSARRGGGHRHRGHRAGRRQRRRERHGHGRRRESDRARRHAEYPQHEPDAELRRPRHRPVERDHHRPRRSAGVEPDSRAGRALSRPSSSTTSATVPTR